MGRGAERSTWDFIRNAQVRDPRLRELNIWYRDHVAGLGIRTFVYYETLPTARMLVVDATTAAPGIPGVRPIPVDEDHVTICKPASKDTRIYRQVKRLIEETVIRSGQTPQTSSLTPLSQSDSVSNMLMMSEAFNNTKGFCLRARLMIWFTTVSEGQVIVNTTNEVMNHNAGGKARSTTRTPQ